MCKLNRLLLRNPLCLTVWKLTKSLGHEVSPLTYMPLRKFGLSKVADMEPEMTMEEVRSRLRKRAGIEEGYEPTVAPRDHLLEYHPKLEDLPARCMADSLSAAIIPLSSNKILRNIYASHFNRVRVGRLMEDMDSFAVWGCYQHIHVPKLPEGVLLPYTFVTILVDMVEFNRLENNCVEDIRIAGHISCVGRTSIEVFVQADQKENGVYQNITKAAFLMAARNATRTGPAPVNPIKPADEEESEILRKRSERMQQRRAQETPYLFDIKPNEEEFRLMGKLYQVITPEGLTEPEKAKLPENARWISSTETKTDNYSFPQHRNLHNTIFGGYLMRLACETSWLCALKHCKARPAFVRICDVSFKRPVNISDFIATNSYVVFTHDSYVVTMTLVGILNYKEGSRSISNVIYCIFKAPEPVMEILPKSYHEFMWYLQGRRKYIEAMGCDSVQIDAPQAGQ